MPTWGNDVVPGPVVHFFLSYPRTRWPDTQDEGESDHWVNAFSRDLTAEVAAQAARTRAVMPGVAQMEAALGAIPPVRRVSVALANCRVFVPLYSPEYFDSPQCGREWTVFNDRVQADYAATAHVKDAVVPVLWQPLDSEAVPPIARRYQLYSDALGEVYRRRGIRQLLLQRPLREQYRAALSALARQIVVLAERGAPAPGPQRVLERAPDAFATAGWSPADRRELRIVVAAPVAGRLPRGPSPDVYGAAPEHWRPYWPDQPSSVAQIAERIGRALGFHPIVEPFEQCSELRSGGRATAPTLLLVDPWATQEPLLAERLLRFDLISKEKTWVRLAVPWNRGDDGTNNHVVELNSGLLRVLQRTSHRCQVETPAAVAGLRTAADFNRELPSVISTAEKRFLQQVRAFPPDAPRRNAPSWRPRLRGPVSDAGPQDEGEEPHAGRP